MTFVPASRAAGSLLSLLLLSAAVLAEYEYPIRPIDGRGANPDHPEWGAAGEPYLRFASAEYDAANGTVEARSSEVTPRAVSNNLCGFSPAGKGRRDDLTDFITFWGQFVDHDIDRTPAADPPERLSYDVSSDAVWTRTHFNVTRSSYVIDESAVRQQVNVITAYLDGSAIYGSDAGVMEELREGQDGLMDTSEEGLFLPRWDQGGSSVVSMDSLANRDPATLFAAGDARANENPALLSLHTLMVLEHNRYAAEYKRANKDATDEEIFQAARAWTVAVMQSITYYEWLPALFNTDEPLEEYSGWDKDVDPTIMTEFATVAFRYGHSEVNSLFLRLDSKNTVIEAGHRLLRDSFFNPSVVQDHEDGIAVIFRGLAAQSPGEVDSSVVDDIRHFLFPDALKKGSHGDDLASVNIARGRDHGVANYNELRRVFDLDPVEDFETLADGSSTILPGLLNSYSDIDSVDPWIGGLLEVPIEGTSLGPLFTTIILEQFRRLRDGDPFWFEREDVLPNSVRRQARARTLGEVIRDNTAISGEIPDNVFKKPPVWSEWLVIVGIAAGAAVVAGMAVGVIMLRREQSLRRKDRAARRAKAKAKAEAASAAANPATPAATASAAGAEGGKKAGTGAAAGSDATAPETAV